MSVQELSRERLQQLKMNYIGELVDEGIYGEIMFGNPNITEPSYEDYASIDELVSDEFIKEHYADVLFTDDDFWG